MELKTGSIVNTERKFIVVRDDYFDKFITDTEFIEELLITQFYIGNYKYRKIESNGDIKYTESIKNGDITEIKEISKKTYDNNSKKVNHFIKKNRLTYKYNGYYIDVDSFILPKVFRLVEISSIDNDLKKIEKIKGLVEVTDNQLFDNINIFSGSIIASNIYLEGTDGVGKTSLIKELLNDGIICQDRDTEISNYMLKSISLDEKINRYKEYLKSTDKLIIFMINNDTEEIDKRINSRDHISEFDREANLYNDMYNEVYLELERLNLLNNNLYRIDCTSKTIFEEKQMIKRIISNNTCLFVGSFDVWQNGHQERLTNALKIFDKVIVVIASNENKKDFWFTQDERMKQIRKCTSNFGDRVIVKKYPDLMLYEICRLEGVYKVFRGVKGTRTMDEEIRLQKFTRYMSNTLYKKDILFVYDITGDDDFRGSSLVKKLALKNYDFSSLVPKEIIIDIKKKAKELGDVVK